MRKILFAITLFLSVAMAQAQSQHIAAERYADGDYLEDLSGDCGVLFLSKAAELVINVPNALEVQQKYIGKDENGLHQYMVIIPGNDTRTPKFEVSRRGNVYKATFVKEVKPNFVIAYKVSEPEEEIQIEDQTRPGDAHLNAEEAEIEISSTLDNLAVQLPPALQAKITRSFNKADNSVKVISVIIPIKPIKDARDRIKQMETERAALNKKLVDDADGNATDDEWNRLDQLDADLQKAGMELEALQTVYVYREKTNRVAVDISDIGPRSKKCLVVVPLKEEVFVTECSARMKEAADMFTQMKYKEALNLYETAMNSEGCTDELRQQIQNIYIKECQTCLLYDINLKKALKRTMELQRQGTATQMEVFNTYSEAYGHAKVLYECTSNPRYEPMLEKFDKELKGIPINLSLTCVEWISSSGSFREGGPIAGMQVYAFSGDYIPTTLPKSAKKFKEAILGNKNYTLLGETGVDGNIIMKLSRENPPTGIVLCPRDNHFNVEFKAMRNILSESKGSYLERQFRMKLYRK